MTNTIYLLEITNPPSLEAVAVSMPESLWILTIGVGLALSAVFLRTFFARAERSKSEKGIGEEV